MDDFSKKLKEKLNELTKLNLQEGIKKSTTFSISGDYIKKKKVHYSSVFEPLSLLRHDLDTNHRLNKSFEVELIKNSNNINTIIRERETNKTILSFNNTEKEFYSTEIPFYELNNEFSNLMAKAIEDKSFKILPEIHEQHFILSKLINDTYLYNEDSKNDISTTELFKKELNELVSTKIDKDLQPLSFTNMIDIPDTTIKNMIENSNRNLIFEELEEKIYEVYKANSSGVKKYDYNLGNAAAGLDRYTEIKIKLANDNGDNVVKVAVDGKQFSFKASKLDDDVDRSEVIEALNNSIIEAADEKAIFYKLKHYINDINAVNRTLRYYFKGIDKDLPIDTIKEKALNKIDKKSRQLGLEDHKDMLTTFYDMATIEDEKVEIITKQLAETYKNSIEVEDLAPVYSHLQDYELSNVAYGFYGLSKLPRTTTQEILNDLKLEKFINEAKEYQKVNGEFEGHRSCNKEVEFLRQYIESKVSSKEELTSITDYDLINSLSMANEHNKDFNKAIVRNNMLEF